MKLRLEVPPSPRAVSASRSPFVIDRPSTTVAGGAVAMPLQGPPGPPGPPGPIGPAGGSALVRRAATSLSGHRVVRERPDGDAEYADPSDLPGLNTVLGITSGASLAGADATVVAAGELEEPSWAWTPGARVYLAAGGALTQIVPTSGALMVVGVATSATSMLVRIAPPIQLA